MDLVDPLPTSPLWLITGIALLILVLGCLLAMLLGRRMGSWAGPPAPILRPTAGVPGDPAAIVASLEAAWTSGEITPRDAARRLSRVLRGHATSLGERDAPSMTLVELRRSRSAAQIAPIIDRLYTVQFAGGAAELSTHGIGEDHALHDEPRAALGWAFSATRRVLAPWI